MQPKYHKYLKYKTKYLNLKKLKQQGGALNDYFIYIEGITEQTYPDTKKWLEGIKNEQINKIDFNESLAYWLDSIFAGGMTPFIDVDTYDLPENYKNQMKNVVIFAIDYGGSGRQVRAKYYIQINKESGKIRVIITFQRSNVGSIISQGLENIKSEIRNSSITLKYPPPIYTIPVVELNKNTSIPPYNIPVQKLSTYSTVAQ